MAKADSEFITDLPAPMPGNVRNRVCLRMSAKGNVSALFTAYRKAVCAHEEAEREFIRAERVFLRIVDRTSMNDKDAYRAAGVGPLDARCIALCREKRAALERLVDKACVDANDVESLLVRGAVVAAMQSPAPAND